MQPDHHSDNRVNTYTNMPSLSSNDIFSSTSNQWTQNDKDNLSRSLSFLTNSSSSNSSSNNNQLGIFTSSSPPSLPPIPSVSSSSSILDSRYYPMSSSSTSLLPSSTATTTTTSPISTTSSSSSHLYQPYPVTNNRAKSNSFYDHTNQHLSYTAGYSYPKSISRPRLTTILWEDESTICYQVDCRGICVARRQDNDMINGTKLLNVAGMSRGKRDGILKNERGRIVVKVGAMHLKGVWIPFVRAKALAAQFKIYDALYPIFSDNPTSFLYPSHFHQLNQYKANNNNRHLFSTDSGSVVNTTATMLTTDITKGNHLYYNQQPYHDYQTKQEKEHTHGDTEYTTGASTTPVLKRLNNNNNNNNNNTTTTSNTKPEDHFLNNGSYYSNSMNNTMETKVSEYPSLPSISSPNRRSSSKPIW